MKYHFIEIGTSDFDTQLQLATEEGGLSIDAVKLYLDRLPDKPGVTKINCAVSDHSGTLDVYYVTPETIADKNLPDWMRGCSSVGSPHPKAIERLGRDSPLIECKSVEVKTLRQIFEENDVTECDYLKIDTEGHDTVILGSLADCSVRPKTIRFETNELQSSEKVETCLKFLQTLSYRIVHRGNDTVVRHSSEPIHVFVFNDPFWSIGRVHRGIEKHLTDEFKFKYAYEVDTMETYIQNADICLATFCAYDHVEALHRMYASKIAYIAHGYPDFRPGFSDAYLYTITSPALKEFVPSHVDVGLTPNGVDPSEFSYVPRDGSLKTMGWCGAETYRKRPEMAKSISDASGIPLSLATKLTFDEVKEWYHTIDILIMTSGPEPWTESGPLPPYEAVVSGIPVIGTRVGNFVNIPGPKFDTVEEAVSILQDLSVNPETMVSLAKEQYAYVMENCTFERVSPLWRSFLKRLHQRHQLAVMPPVIRLHMLAIPHTVTTSEFSHCAFTGKVKRFAPMMRARGFEVFHYGVEGSDSGADRDVELMTRDEWDIFRILSYKKLHPDVPHDEVVRRLEDPTQYIGNLGNWDTPLYREFNLRLKDQLKENYRSTETDIVCLPFGRAHDAALEGLNAVAVESGIGYPDSYRNYRIFESHTWMHSALAKESKSPQNYWFIAPNYFDLSEWTLSLNPIPNTVGFFGRINDGKGCHLIVEVARRMPHVTFFLCGQGDPTPYLKCPNIHYKAPIHGAERSDYLGRLSALLAPTQWVEPFCGVAVEAQLCGTPVITSDWGAQTETVEPFKTGLHCHTLADYCLGIQMALDGKFDRTYIRERAVSKYSLEAVGKSYEYALKSIMDVHNGKNGWYSDTSHLACMVPAPASSGNNLP